MSRALLVTGATGKQGGAVIKALQLRDTEFRLLALTRDTSSRSARHLASKFPSVTLIQGNLNDTDSIFRNIKASTNFDIWGVFGVQVKTVPREKLFASDPDAYIAIDSLCKGRC